MDTGQSSTQSPPKSSAFFIGQNSRGNWVARDQEGLRGGLFVSRAEAVRYAMLANIHHPQDVIMVSDTLELDATNAEPFAAIESASSVVELRSRHSPSIVPEQSASVDDAQSEYPRRVANGR
jgi:hypothetical protein